MLSSLSAVQPAVDIEFSAERHEYRIGGTRWPSVTEVLDPLLELDGIPKHLLKAAAEFGSHVHQACHLHNVGALNWSTLDPVLAPYVEAWRDFLDENNAIVIASEQRVAHPKLRYAGTLDAIIRLKGQKVLADIKTSATVPRTVGPQTAAYQYALGDLTTVRRCVHLRPDGTYRLHKLTDRADWNLFLSALNVHQWRHRHAA